MFSGKSEELMRRLRRSIIARKRVQVFKPIIDDRYSSSDEIVSHNDLRMKSQAIQTAMTFCRILIRGPKWWGWMNRNLFGPDLVEVATHLADSGKAGAHRRLGYRLHGIARLRPCRNC